MRGTRSGLRCALAGLFAMLTASGASPSFAAEADQKQAVLEVEAVRLQAMLDGDVETLDRITGKDYVHVTTTGKLRTKAQFLDGFKDKEYAFESFVNEESKVQILGDSAIVSGRYHNVIRTPEGLQPVKHARFMRVYALRDGKWINVAHQATEIPSETK